MGLQADLHIYLLKKYFDSFFRLSVTGLSHLIVKRMLGATIWLCSEQLIPNSPIIDVKVGLSLGISQSVYPYKDMEVKIKETNLILTTQAESWKRQKI